MPLTGSADRSSEGPGRVLGHRQPATETLAGTEPPSFPDTETDFAGLYARIDRALEVVRGFDAAQLDGSEGRTITVPRRGRDPLQLDGQSYLLHYILPNLFFHASITYAILREAGVALGKDDFIGAH